MEGEVSNADVFYAKAKTFALFRDVVLFKLLFKICTGRQLPAQLLTAASPSQL